MSPSAAVRNTYLAGRDVDDTLPGGVAESAGELAVLDATTTRG